MNTKADTSRVMRTETANTTAEFKELVKEAKATLTQDGSCESEFWYRGHDRGIYTLTPSLFRYYDPEDKQQLIFRIYSRHVQSDKLHHPDPWAKIIWMQEHGVPTRLLDWTVAEDVAKFFAVKFLNVRRAQHDRHADRPCIYVLNPERLNLKNQPKFNRCGVLEVPTHESTFEAFFQKNTTTRLDYPLAVVPVSPALNDRLVAQFGRFTVHGVIADPLETLAPECLFCISLSDSLCDEFRAELETSSTTNHMKLFPDVVGIAQFVASKANLKPISYDQKAAQIIRRRLEMRLQEERSEAQKPDTEEYSRLFGSCNLTAKTYIPRPEESKQLLVRLEEGPAFVFVIGEAGIGKTNFIRENLLMNDKLVAKLSLVFPLSHCDCTSSVTSVNLSKGAQLLDPLFRILVGDDDIDRESLSVSQMYAVARQMIVSGLTLTVLTAAALSGA